MGKYSYEENFWFHCQQDLDGVLDPEHRKTKTFDTFEELLLRLGVSHERENLSILVIEENEKSYPHKILLKDNYCLCSFDHFFEVEIPLSKYEKKDILVNNINVFLPYSKFYLKRYAETGSVYGKLKPF